MAETFLLGEQKVRAGVYFRREKVGVNISGATNGVLSILFQSNWGELNKAVDVDASMFNNLEDYYGDGAVAVREGLIGGATTVRAVRVGGDGGTASKATLKAMGTEDVIEEQELTFTVTGGQSKTVELDNAPIGGEISLTSGNLEVATYTLDELNLTVAADAFNDETEHEIKAKWNAIVGTRDVEIDAVEINARYVGDRSFTASIRTNLITNKRQLLIYTGTEVFTAVSFDASDDEAQGLVDALANNRYFTGRKLAAGKLNDVVQVQLTGGTNPTVTTESYTKGTELLERYRWNCIVADTDDPAVNGILGAFVRQSYETGHLGFACIAGKSTEDLETRMAFAAACNDEKIVYLLNGWRSIDGTIYDGWRAGIRIGGMIAACDTNTSLTHDVVANALELIEPLTNGEIIRAEERGCLVLSLNNEDQVWIDNAINTLVTPDDNQDDGWKKIRRTKTRFEALERVNTTCDRLIGKINNNRTGRGTIMAAAQGVLNEMIGEGKLFSGSNVEEDIRYTPEGDRAYFVLNIGDIDSIEKLYLTYRFSYANPFTETTA